MSRPDPAVCSEKQWARPDWRCWLALAWALWFGLLYAGMVVDQRGGKLRGMLAPSPPHAGPPADRTGQAPVMPESN